MPRPRGARKERSSQSRNDARQRRLSALESVPAPKPRSARPGGNGAFNGQRQRCDVRVERGAVWNDVTI